MKATELTISLASVVQLAQLAVSMLAPLHFQDFALEASAEGMFTDLGEVSWPDLPTSVPEAQTAFLRGLALLHSFLFDFSADSFRQAQRADPDLGIAYWGEAMARCAIFWGIEDLPRGREVLQRAAARTALRFTHREQRLMDAAKALYGDGDREVRLAAYLAQMSTAIQEYPDDVEVALLWLVLYMAQIFPYTRGYVTRFGSDPSAFARAQNISAEMMVRYPSHPGALHYSIHLWDMPATVNKATFAVQTYGKSVASSVPHAHHMPSHIHLRKGDWKACVVDNVHAMAQMEKILDYFQLPANAQESHNVEFLQYALLMSGRFSEARNFTAYIQSLTEVETEEALHAANEFRWRTMSARQILAEGLLNDVWPQQTVELPPRPNCTTCWVDAGDAQFLFAVEAYSAATFSAGIHAYAIGDVATGANASEILGRLVHFLENVPPKPWFGPHPLVRIMNLQLRSFGAFIRNKSLGAWLESMGQAFDEETASGPPGYDPPYPLVPTGELMGTLLLRSFLGSPPVFPKNPSLHEEASALRAIQLFSSVAAVSPNRSSCLLGAARAHRVLQQTSQACEAYKRLLAVFDGADEGLSIVDEAELYVKHRHDAIKQASYMLGAIVVVALAFILISLLAFRKCSGRCCAQDLMLPATGDAPSNELGSRSFQESA